MSQVVVDAALVVTGAAVMNPWRVACTTFKRVSKASAYTQRTRQNRNGVCFVCSFLSTTIACTRWVGRWGWWKVHHSLLGNCNAKRNTTKPWTCANSRFEQTKALNQNCGPSTKPRKNTGINKHQLCTLHRQPAVDCCSCCVMRFE